MPKWGLTPAMRKTEPWGLSAELLEPGKVITDPVHGDIHLLKLEVALVDSPAFQRLRRVRQLGTTHLVYPGATHTRFSHSLGAVKVAQDLVDTAVDQRSGVAASHDLFAQWEGDLAATYGEDEGAARRELDRRIAEVTVLARLGALLHDLSHVPFGHSIEDDLQFLEAHDANLARFRRLWAQIPWKTRKALAEADELMPNLERLILSKYEKHVVPARYPFVGDIVGNTICADLLDYLRRDHLYTGLPLALGYRFTSGYYVTPDGDPQYQQRMVLRVDRHGDERMDVITEILKHLRYRYELSERALVHKTKLAADAMVGKALEIWHDALWVESASDLLGGDSDDAPEFPAGRDVDEIKVELERRKIRVKRVDAMVRNELEQAMTLRGDDGLLEYLCELCSMPRTTSKHWDASRRGAVQSIAMALRDRDLYKRIAIQRHSRGDRLAYYERLGDPTVRRQIEARATRFAGLEHSYHVVVWLPAPKMRLKVAEVIVDDGKEIRRFVDREREGRHRGTDIYDAHENLWGVSIFAHRSVLKDEDKLKLVLASLSADLDMQFGDLAPELGKSTHEWPDRLAIARLRKELTETQKDELLARRMRKLRAARRSDDRPSIKALVVEYQELLLES